MKEIQLTQGKFAIVDDDDFELLNQWKWHISASGYAARRIPKVNGKQAILFMHRILLGLSLNDGICGDHINGIRIDNRKCNLRIASKLENGKNVKKHKDNLSGYKGVYLNKDRNKWAAQICTNGKTEYLGLFESPELAYEEYCKESIKRHGDFSNVIMHQKDKYD